MKNKHCSYDSSRVGESERLNLARKEMKEAWIALIIVSVVMTALFNSAWWSIIPRVILFIHAIDKSTTYSRIKKEENVLKTQKSSQKKYVHANTDESSYYGKQEQPTVTIIKATSDEGSIFCPLCGSKHERNAVYCSACGTDLKLGA